MGATRKRTRSSSDSMPDPNSLGWASVRKCPPRGAPGIDASYHATVNGPRRVRILMWLPWLVVAALLYVVGGAAYVVAPFLFVFLVFYLVRRKVRRSR